MRQLGGQECGAPHCASGNRTKLLRPRQKSRISATRPCGPDAGGDVFGAVENLLPAFSIPPHGQTIQGGLQV